MSALQEMTGEWPESDLEAVRSCPACGSMERTVLYRGLRDRVAFCAPGEWIVKRCSDCRCSYLDPRPTKVSIGRAYSEYYTHQAREERTPYSDLSFFRKIRRQVADGYSNQRYGTQFSPARRVGGFVAHLAPRLRRELDRRFRFMPRPRPGARLLDVGSGSGAFLMDAQRAGWMVAGVDPDPRASSASIPGVEFRVGGIEQFLDQPGQFDAICLSHVIEHLHDPAQAVRDASTLLKPGGLLYLDTPNIDSLGHACYGRDWRPLEPPRHLVLFNWDALERLLSSNGFEISRRVSRPEPALWTFPKSDGVRRGARPVGRLQHTVLGRSAFLAGLVLQNRQEYLTLFAKRQG